METALQSFFVSIPQAAALWLVILLAIAVAGAYVGLPRSAPVPPLTPAQADEMRYADEVVVAVERAATTAARRRGEWAAAQEGVDAAWRAFDEADRAARQGVQAAAFPLMSRRRKPGENADRQRYLHHAAIAACRRREISMAQLDDVLAHRGWNPRLHPVVQEGLLRNAIRAHRMSQYEDAQKLEQAAWHESELAAEAVRTLRTEAAAAIVRAAVTKESPADDEWFADQWATGEIPATKAYA